MNASLICLLKNKLGKFLQIGAFGHIAVTVNAIHTLEKFATILKNSLNE